MGHGDARVKKIGDGSGFRPLPRSPHGLEARCLSKGNLRTTTVTNWREPLTSKVRRGRFSESMGETRVNAEQASKMQVVEADPLSEQGTPHFQGTMEKNWWQSLVYR